MRVRTGPVRRELAQQLAELIHKAEEYLPYLQQAMPGGWSTSAEGGSAFNIGVTPEIINAPFWAEITAAGFDSNGQMIYAWKECLPEADFTFVNITDGDTVSWNGSGDAIYGYAASDPPEGSGSDGDVWINTATVMLFVKADGEWGSGSPVQPLSTGSGPPSGDPGEFNQYLDTDGSGTLYGVSSTDFKGWQGGRIGTLILDPAYEANRKRVPVGVKVLMQRAYLDTANGFDWVYIFEIDFEFWASITERGGGSGSGSGGVTWGGPVNLDNGAGFSVGDIDPNGVLEGSQNDRYVDLTTGIVWNHNEGSGTVWTLAGTIPNPPVLAGSGPPGDVGENGDYYIDSNSAEGWLYGPRTSSGGSGSGDCIFYGYEEVVGVVGGCSWQVKDDGYTGTTTANPAREANEVVVDVGSVVLMKLDYWDAVRGWVMVFDGGGSGGGSLTVESSTGDPSYGGITTIQVVDQSPQYGSGVTGALIVSSTSDGTARIDVRPASGISDGIVNTIAQSFEGMKRFLDVYTRFGGDVGLSYYGQISSSAGAFQITAYQNDLDSGGADGLLNVYSFGDEGETVAFRLSSAAAGGIAGTPFTGAVKYELVDADGNVQTGAFADEYSIVLVSGGIVTGAIPLADFDIDGGTS